MADEKGQESGQLVPHGLDAFTWKVYVESLVEEFGGWTDLADALSERAPEGDVPVDPKSIEKQLRRLAKKNNRGDKYGKLLLRYFGLPPSIAEWGRLMGQYHSRFADLPVGIRRQQLLRWDRPPVSETGAAMWVHLGLASLAHRGRQMSDVQDRLRLASEVKKPERAAQIEFLLLSARVASDGLNFDEEGRLLDEAERQFDPQTLSKFDADCYRARIIDQRAYRTSRGWRADRACLLKARDLYASLPADVPPFAALRRDLGLAWCAWRLGNPEEALRLGQQANDHAGDGGYVRFRIMALKLMAEVTADATESGRLRVRAARLARALDDEDLVERVNRYTGRVTPTTP